MVAGQFPSVCPADRDDRMDKDRPVIQAVHFNYKVVAFQWSLEKDFVCVSNDLTPPFLLQSINRGTTDRTDSSAGTE
jgi:hypothetical protein